MEISETSEGINEPGKKTAKRVLCVELLCHYFVRTYDKFFVNCLLNFSLDDTPFLRLRPHLGQRNSVWIEGSLVLCAFCLRRLSGLTFVTGIVHLRCSKKRVDQTVHSDF